MLDACIKRNSFDFEIDQLSPNLSNLSIDKSYKYDDLILKALTQCISQQVELESTEHLNELSTQEALLDYFKMWAIDDATTTTDDNYDENSIIGIDGRISLAYENLRVIPQKIAENFANEIKFLDLSFNNFKDLSFLSYFKQLHTLILDKNPEPDEGSLPFLANLQILWLNNCNIINIPKWIYRIQMQCPKIKHLSLIGNPGARTLLTGANSIEESDYRLFVSEILKTLTHLDGIPVPVPSELTTSQNNGVTGSQFIQNTLTGTRFNQYNSQIPFSILIQQHQQQQQQQRPITTSSCKTKSSQQNNENISIFYKNNTINSTSIATKYQYQHNTTKLSSSTSTKSFYINNNINNNSNSPKQYNNTKQQCNNTIQQQRNIMHNNIKDKSFNTIKFSYTYNDNNNANNNDNENIIITGERKKKTLKNSFKDLFRFNSTLQRTKSYQNSSTTS